MTSHSDAIDPRNSGEPHHASAHPTMGLCAVSGDRPSRSADSAARRSVSKLSQGAAAAN